VCSIVEPRKSWGVGPRDAIEPRRGSVSISGRNPMARSVGRVSLSVWPRAQSFIAGPNN